MRRANRRWMGVLCAALAGAAALFGCGREKETATESPEAAWTAEEAVEAAVEEAYTEADAAEEEVRYADSLDQIPEEVYDQLKATLREAADEQEAFLASKDNFMIRTEFGPREGYETVLLVRRDPEDHSGMDTADSLGLICESSMTEYVEEQEEPWGEHEIWYLAYVRDLVIGPEGWAEADPEGIEVRIFDSYEDLYQWYVGDNEAAYAVELRAWEETL